MKHFTIILAFLIGITANAAVFDTVTVEGNTTLSGSTANTVPYLNGSKVFTSSAVTPTELGYLSGVTSGIQAQIGGKEATITATTSADYYRGDKTFQPFAAAAQSAVVTQLITNGVTATSPSEDAVFDAFALKAPLASPALTGNPTAPTQAALDNSTKLATTAYTDSAVAAGSAALLTTSITNGDVTHAPDGNSVFDALALKADANNSALTGTSTIDKILLPETVSPNASILFTESGNDTGIGSNADGRIFFEIDNSEAMHLDGTGLTVNGNISAANYPPTGTNNTLAIFDGSGVLAASSSLGFTTGTLLQSNVSPTLVGSDLRGIDFATAGSTDQEVYGFRFNSATNATGSFHGADLVTSGIVNNATMFSGDSSGTIGNDYKALSSNNSASIGGSYQASNITNSGNIVSHYFGHTMGNTGTVGGDFHVLSSTNSGDIGANYAGIGIQNQADVAGNLSMLDLSNLSGKTVSGGVQMFHITSDSAITGNETLVNLHSSSVTGGNKQGIDLQLQGSSPNVQAFNISVNSVTSANQKSALNINGGSFSANYGIDTADFTPAAFGSVHNLGGQLTISSGSPLLATPLFLNNFGFQIGFADDVTADNSLGAGDSIGTSIMAFVNQVSGANGKTFDTLNYVFLGGSNSNAGTGFINELNIYRGVGLLNAGGGLTVGTQRMFYVDPGFDGALGTTKFGFINASNTDNWFKKNLILGGSTGTPVSGAELDVSGSGSFSGTLDVGGIATLGNGSNAVTQGPGDNSTKLATTAYVENAVAAVTVPVTSVFSRTGAVVAVAGDYTATQVTNTPAGAIAAVTVQAAINELDTEKQALLTNSAGLASALSDETGTGFAVFSASPALSGSPTAPTQTALDNSTKIATTAYVDAAVASGATQASANISGTTTLNSATAGYYFGNTTGGAFTVTLPAAASNDGKHFYLMNVTFGGANNISVARTGADLINAATSDIVSPGESKHYASNGTSWFVIP